MDPEIFDVVIIGGGASGITAAIYTVRKNLKVLMLTQNIGGQTTLSGDVENYPGFTMITGEELSRKFREELLNFEDKGLWVKEGVQVVDLSGKDLDFTVRTAEGEQYLAKKVIIASGRVPRMLGIPGEEELFGKGVTTCATCTASFFENKDVAIVGGGNSALDAAFTLLKIVRSVTIINITDSLRGDEVLMNNVTSSKKTKVLNSHEVLEILGDKFVGGIKVRDNITKKEEILTVSGVFIEIGWVPSTAFDKLTQKNEKNEIIVDSNCMTTVAGIYACGDVNNAWGEQIVIATGEGAKAGLALANDLAKIPN